MRMIVSLEFIEAPLFTELLPRYLSDDEYRQYYHFAEDMQIWFLTLCGKDETSDLTAKERGLLKVALEEEKRQRARRRVARRE